MTSKLRSFSTWSHRKTCWSTWNQALERSEFFGARFRECAGRALLLTRRKINQRTPLWMNRLRSGKLLEAVRPYPEFPIRVEAHRTSLQDEMDLPGLITVLTELTKGSITWSETVTARPSPMAETMTWQQVNKYMYLDETPRDQARSTSSPQSVIDEMFKPGTGPGIPPDIAHDIQFKLQRTTAGYAPGSPWELLDWVNERRLIPYDEWEQLLERIRLDTGEDIDALIQPIHTKLVAVKPERCNEHLLAAADSAALIQQAYDSAGAAITMTVWNTETVFDSTTGPENLEDDPVVWLVGSGCGTTVPLLSRLLQKHLDCRLMQCRTLWIP